MNAQIFLSCGQNHEERPIAESIKNKIEKSNLGFGCYVACEVQDLSDLRDVIFKRLEESDYFVFVDFKLEELKDKKDKNGRPIHRGSLFTNQELAVASYIGLGSYVLLLQEEGVEERGGVLNAVLSNQKEGATRFKSAEKDALPDRVYKLIKTKLDSREWNNQTRNTLALSVFPHSEYLRQRDGRIIRPFHVQVNNLHHRKDARNCLAYLDEVVNLTTNQKINHGWETAEFKWAHTKLAAVRITPKPSYRFFDAAWLLGNQGEIEMAFFNPVVPSHTDYYPYKLGPGKYRLTFSVISDNFIPVQKNFIFEFGQTLESGKLSEET